MVAVGSDAFEHANALFHLAVIAIGEAQLLGLGLFRAGLQFELALLMLVFPLVDRIGKGKNDAQNDQDKGENEDQIAVHQLASRFARSCSISLVSW